MITVPGLTVTTVVDQIYDTSAGSDVVVSATGTTTPPLTGALIPIGNEQWVLVVGPPGRLYALDS